MANVDVVIKQNEPAPRVLSPESLNNLRKWNIFLGCFHIVTGVIIMIITNKDAYTPAYSFFSDEATRGRAAAWGPKPQNQYKNIVGYFSGVFLLLAGIDHAACAIFRSTYENQLAKNQNHFRWIEYSLSASFMHIEVGMLSGMMDIHLLFCIYGLTATTMLFGSLQELFNAHLWGRPQEKSMIPFWMGCVPHMFNWLVLLCYFFVGVSRGDPPGFVWAIIFIIFILDSTFAINQYLQQKEIGKWSDYLYGEWVFCVLSLVAKQLLAWLNFGGTASLNNDAE